MYLRNDAFFFQDAEDAHFLFDQSDGIFQIQPKVNEFPFDAFLLVLLLFQHKHVVVEELLQALVGVIDAKLLKRVQLENFKTWEKGMKNEDKRKRIT